MKSAEVANKKDLQMRTDTVGLTTLVTKDVNEVREKKGGKFHFNAPIGALVFI